MIILYPIVSQIVVELEGELSLSQFVVVLIMGTRFAHFVAHEYHTYEGSMPSSVLILVFV